MFGGVLLSGGSGGGSGGVDDDVCVMKDYWGGFCSWNGVM